MLGVLGLVDAGRKALKNRWVQIGVAIAIVVGVAWFGYQKYQGEKQRRIVAELQLKGQQEILDGVTVRLSSTEVAKDSLQELLAAANKLNGKLLAGVKINIPKRDTTFVHDTLPTDGVLTRTAEFADSAFGIHIAGTITAPPPPGPLGVKLMLTRDPFSPSVGFVRVGDSTVAVVTWKGQSVRVTAPYFKPPVKTLPFLGGYVEANYTDQEAVEGRAGGLLRLGQKWRVQASVEKDFPFHDKPVDPVFSAGIRREF